MSTVHKFSTVGSGRKAIYIPNHPNANNRGYVLYSRYLMEQSLGRYLDSNEEVHHINKDKTDDRIENLELLSKDDHARFHAIRGENGCKRTLDYDLIFSLMQEGLGYKRIAQKTGYPIYSCKSACIRIKKELEEN